MIGIMGQSMKPDFQRLRNTVTEILGQVKVLPILPSNIDNEELASGWEPVLESYPHIKEALLAFYETEEAIQVLRRKFSSRRFDGLFEKYKNLLSIITSFFDEHPELLGEIKEDCDVSDGFDRFLRTLEMHNAKITQKLSSAFDDIGVREDKENEFDMKFKKLQTDKKNHEKQLSKVKKARRQENKRLDVSIERITQEIDSFQNNLDEKNREFLVRYQARENNCKEEYRNTVKKLEEEIEYFKKDILETKNGNSKLEKESRLVVKNKEMFVNGSIKKYDNFMFSNTNEIFNLNKNFEIDKKRIEYLEKEVSEFRKQKNEAKKKKDEEISEFRFNLRKIHSYVLLKLSVKNMLRKHRDSKSDKKGKGKGKAKGKGKKGKGKGKKRGKKGTRKGKGKKT